MENSDVEAGVENAVDFIGTLWSGVEAVIDVLPPIVLGGIVFALLILWAFNKVRG